MDFETFEDRLENWARVVRLPKYQSGVCAQWARWYVSIRDSESKYAGPAVSVSRDELDAWQVEAAWSQMPPDVRKWTLKYHYIWGMHDSQVITRLRKVHKINMRGRPWELILSDSQRGLSKVLIRNLAHTIISEVSRELEVA